MSILPKNSRISDICGQLKMMMRRFQHLALFTLLTLLATSAWTQQDLVPSDKIEIMGEVESPITVTLAEIAAMPSVKIKDIKLLNHNGESKGSLKGLKGVPIKHVLQQVQFNSESPKGLSTFYFVFVATDGYKVVFSWNELYNNAIGDQVYLLTEMGGQSLATLPNRIALVTSSDVFTGRRYVKSLSKILVRRATEP